MKVNIYYGGRGLIEDPTIYVINKLATVLTEIRVEVTRYNLYEEKNSITMLPKTLKEADGIILASHLEWMGIGGYMQEFLDACWLYGDKEKISSIYMMPVVLAETYGEREAEQTLLRAWELLGGISCSGLSAYVENHLEFETNPDYADFIEKRAESLYRSINQKQINLPSSNYAVKATILRTNSIDLTPQESEQLSIYVSDDTYVKKQKEDIEELTRIFKEMLDSDDIETGVETSLSTPDPVKTAVTKLVQKKSQSSQLTSQNTDMKGSFTLDRAGLQESTMTSDKSNIEVNASIMKTDEAGKIVSNKPAASEKGNSKQTQDKEMILGSSLKKQELEKKEERKTKLDTMPLNQNALREEMLKPVLYIPNFKKNFKPIKDLHASYAIHIVDMNQTLIVETIEEKLNCYYGNKENVDVIARTTKTVMDQLIQGRITFQNAFMSGALTAKGNFKTLRIFDTIFQFNIL